jgi:hypothetical protein
VSKTFIQLVQDLKREAGVSGAVPSAVTSQPAEIDRLVNWILKAYTDIQNKHTDWQFLRADVSIDATASTSTYTATDAGIANLFGEWIMDSFRIFRADLGVTDEQVVDACSWDAMRDGYLIGAQRTSAGRPTRIAQKPDQSLALWPLPDQSYTVVGEYYKTAQTLTATTDVPVFPGKYHDMIVWRALMYYAGYESAPELYAVGQKEFNRLMTRMEGAQLPEITVGGAMA